MRIYLLSIFLVSLSLTAFPQTKGKSYQYTVDLTKVVDDRLFVELSTPSVTSSEITFYMPKIIPGTYRIADYGRFVNDFHAFDKKGNKLEVERLNDNAWKIKNATKLRKISYWVDDITDTEMKGPEIYNMAATSFEEGKNYVINTSGIFGYLEGMKGMPFTFNVIRQKDFYGSTGLIPTKTNEPLTTISKENTTATDKRVDTFVTENYEKLIDSPLMYHKPDTAVIRVGNTEVLIGSYSPNNKVTAKEIANSLREVLLAQKAYLGGTLPVDKYAFIFYFSEKPLQYVGALEHSYSSFYYMPEVGIARLNQRLRDFAAHEFFHIVTPLNIHSEEIHEFDFNNPKMSKHLWLYEGVTEYFAGNVQVKSGLITPEAYLNVLRGKLIGADQYMDDVPFTDISKYTLDKYNDQYGNVYEKGALIGMCLDIKLRKLSGGTYGLQNLIADLSMKYGKNKAFQDEALFNEITKLTYPEIGEFLKRHVDGPEKLPYQELLNEVGVTYAPELTTMEFNLGFEAKDIAIAQYNDKPKLSIANADLLNAQGKALGLATGDILMKVNEETIPDLGPDLRTFFEKHKANLKDGGTLSCTVIRTNEAGVKKEVELKAPVLKSEIKNKFVFEFDQKATPEKLALRKAWLSGTK